MTTMNKFRTVIALAGVLALGACGTMDNPGNTSSPGTTNTGSANSGNVYSGYGVVQSIELVKQENTGIGGSGIGIGTLAGAVVGGVVGNQVGSGRGNTAATVIGAAGGAYVGHELENHQQQRTADVYRFNVRMENGSYQTLTQNTNADFRVGDRVQIANGVMRRY